MIGMYFENTPGHFTLLNDHRKGKYQVHTTHPRNLAPTGPISSTRLARASPSISGGGFVSFSFFTSLQVTRVGMHAFPGGTMIRTPEWRHPRMAPPRASTMKLTRKLTAKSQNVSPVPYDEQCGTLNMMNLCVLYSALVWKYKGSISKCSKRQVRTIRQEESFGEGNRWSHQNTLSAVIAMPLYAVLFSSYHFKEHALLLLHNNFNMRE